MSLIPEPDLAESLLSFRQAGAANLLLVRPYSIDTSWLSRVQKIELSAVFLLSALQSEIQVLGFVTDAALPARSDTSVTEQDFYTLAKHYSATVFDLQKAIPLHSVEIPKPWGQEIWFTGMEDRGVSGVSSNLSEALPGQYLENTSVPLPWLLSMAPLFTHQAVKLALLKILDPLPDPVLGDLYFELHSKKYEVYVVTRIDEQAWPDGKAGIRLGMNQDQRTQYSGDNEFRSSFLKAVRAYHAVRKRIDTEPKRIPTKAVRAEEHKLRIHMQSFTAVQSLELGDTVVVQPDMPHSLLHGVRVVEFQSPVYERYIISFAQKVLTQNNWDSEQAIERMQLGAPSLPEFEAVECNDLVNVERIVRFDEFNVWQIRLQPQGIIRLTPNIPYAICMGISGQTHVAGLDILPEHACLIPQAACKLNIENTSNSTSACLIAAPGL